MNTSHRRDLRRHAVARTVGFVLLVATTAFNTYIGCKVTGQTPTGITLGAFVTLMALFIGDTHYVHSRRK